MVGKKSLKITSSMVIAATVSGICNSGLVFAKKVDEGAPQTDVVPKSGEEQKIVVDVDPNKPSSEEGSNSGNQNDEEQIGIARLIFDVFSGTFCFGYLWNKDVRLAVDNHLPVWLSVLAFVVLPAIVYLFELADQVIRLREKYKKYKYSKFEDNDSEKELRDDIEERSFSPVGKYDSWTSYLFNKEDINALINEVAEKEKANVKLFTLLGKLQEDGFIIHDSQKWTFTDSFFERRNLMLFVGVFLSKHFPVYFLEKRCSCKVLGDMYCEYLSSWDIRKLVSFINAQVKEVRGELFKENEGLEDFVEMFNDKFSYYDIFAEERYLVSYRARKRLAEILQNCFKSKNKTVFNNKLLRLLMAVECLGSGLRFSNDSVFSGFYKRSEVDNEIRCGVDCYNPLVESDTSFDLGVLTELDNYTIQKSNV